MADILIRGFEMPTDASLWLMIKPDGTVHKIKAGGKHGEPQQGVAVPLPEGHGRLGDLDALMPDFVKARWEFFSDGDTFLRLLKNAPTIIEADLEWKMKNCCCFSNTDQAEGGTDDG